MKYEVKTIKEYMDQVPDERKPAMKKLWKTIKDNLPEGFKAQLNSNMPGIVVPFKLYPAGYHCDPKLPLPFLNIASQKNFIALYHMGIYADPNVMKWFTDNYPKHCKSKLDMGKSCIRFKKIDDIPYKLIGQLMKKISVKKMIKLYEESFKK